MGSTITYNYVSTTTRDDVEDGYNILKWETWAEATWGAYTIPYEDSNQLYEFDIVFNDRWDWVNGQQANKIDVQNIATHEIGHTIFLNDLELASNSEQTMYSSASANEIKKRSLESGDIAGVRYVYPNIVVTITSPTYGDVWDIVTIYADVTTWTTMSGVTCQYRATGAGYDSGWVNMSGGPTTYSANWNTYPLNSGYYDIQVKVTKGSPYYLEDTDTVTVYVLKSK